MCITFTVRDCLPEGPSRSGKLAIPVTSARISGVLLCKVVLQFLNTGMFIYDSKS